MQERDKLMTSPGTDMDTTRDGWRFDVYLRRYRRHTSVEGKYATPKLWLMHIWGGDSHMLFYLPS